VQIVSKGRVIGVSFLLLGSSMMMVSVGIRSVLPVVHLLLWSGSLGMTIAAIGAITAGLRHEVKGK